MATKLEKLLSIRSRIIGDFEHHVTEAKKFNTESTPALVSFRSVALEKAYKEFVEIGEALERMSAYHDLENLQTLITKNRAIQDSYLEIKLHLLPLMQNDASAAGLNVSFYDTTPRSYLENNERTSTPNQSNRLGLKLPHIQITPFDGKYEAWLEFKETFMSIMKKYNGDNIEKFVHLKSFLRGEALDTVKHLKFTLDSYETAWDLLIGRFQNKNAIIEAHMATLMNLPAISQQSPYTLSQAITTAKGCLAAVQSFEIMTETWDPMIVFILKQKLSPELQLKWEEKRQGTHECPTLKEFLQFLDIRHKILANTSHQNTFKSNTNEFKQRPTKTFVQRDGEIIDENLVDQTTSSVEQVHLNDDDDDDVDAHVMHARNEVCGVCGNMHRVFMCPKLANGAKEALRLIQEKHLCTNCLYKHNVAECQSKGSCKICKERHHTLLHEALSTTKMFHAVHSNQVMHIQPGITRVLLATALVPALAHNGEKVWLRALIDQGSTASLISERGAQMLRCKRRKIMGVPMLGVGDVLTGTARFITTITIGSMYENDFELQISTLITPHISTIKSINRESILQWPHIKDLQLADPSQSGRQDIDLLIGSLPCSQILQNGLIKGGKNEPIAQQTHLGWIISGADATREEHTNVMVNNAELEHCFMITNGDLSDQLKAFWEVEEVMGVTEWSNEEKACDNYFTNNVTRAQDGKFIMRIPFKIDPKTPNFLGNSLENAKKRFYQLERRFARNPKLKEEYANGIREYIELGHAIKKPIEELCHVIPHHAVIKENSTTTRLRTVYDASAKTSNGHSLNDRMHIGPTILEDLWAVLIRWRMGKIALTADIEKMYRQFWVHENDSKYLQILWRDNPTDPFELIELRTVTFGTAAAPYMAIKGLHLIAEAVEKTHPQIANSIKKCFYVDDYVESFDTPQQANQTKTQLTTTLAEYGLNLRKWHSNADDFKTEEVVAMKTHPTALCTTLGMQWNTNNDQISYKVNLDKVIPRVTKRTTLSEIASLFDPLGLLAPIIMQAKAFMQKLWLAKVEWDEDLPPNLKEEWRKIKNSLIRCSKITIPRWIGYTEAHQHVSLHGFCDASEQIYSAACYLRTTQKDGTVEVNLIAAKTRVAPLKSMTIPRLELCAAKLVAKLLVATQNALAIPNMETYAWSDSAVTLAWISTPPYKLKTFVSSRVKDIQALIPPEKWRYVKTTENPADYATRVGVELITLNRWWNGSSFLMSPPDTWPKIPEHMISTKNIPEMKVKILTIQEDNNIEQKENPFLLLYPSLERLLRITALCLRWCKKYRHLKGGPGISTVEITNAKQTWIRCVQKEYYAVEIELLQQSRALPKKSTLLSLKTMLDNDGILRVQGRLKHALLPYAEKHPIILPAKSVFTTLNIRQAHFRAMHGGLQLTLRTTRDEFWITNGKTTVKRYINKCITCYRSRCQPAQQQMADLLAPQVQPNRPFSYTGVDFAGYFDVKTSIRRNAGTHKCYVSLFICLTTKAIHLELARDLTTQAFIDALTRFVARRGIPNRIYSDNGKNFVGTANELPKLFYEASSQESQAIRKEFTRMSIEWHFNPARASHFGGLWEAGVKSMKTHLHRVLKDQKLTFEDFNTTIIQIEACLNSRPLCPISNDPEDVEVLTPGHFLIGQAPLTLPHPNLNGITMSRLSRFQLLRQIYQCFWEQWSKDYLNRLQARPKWKQQHPNLKVGQIVVIKEDDTPPTQWILGRITEVFPDREGLVRSAKVLCKGEPSVLKGGKGKAPIVVSRPIHKLCLLPIEDNMNVDERLIYDQSLIAGEDVE